MNYKVVIHTLGYVLATEAALLLLPLGVSFIYQDGCSMAFALTIALVGLCSIAAIGVKPTNKVFYARDGFVIVSLSWVLMSLFGAIPFWLSAAIPSYVDAFFETVSGFTTTGASILNNVEALSHSLLFWRSFTHWIGGMGVLVFVMAVIPLGNKGAMFLMRAEMPGPTCDKLVPKSRGTAKILYCMYLFLSGVEVLLLLAGGMDLYNAVIHTFSTAGTGGFSSMNASVAAFDSAYIDGVITVFMLLFGINFNLYYLLLLKNVRAVMKSEELRAYLGIVAGAIALITLNILHLYETPLRALRYAAFQVASIITTTGFVTANYELWPELSKTVILLLMIIGACAGSTGGGMKVSRILILSKTIGKEVRQILHPKSVNVVKMDGKRVPGESIHGVYVYLICYLVILCGSVLLVSVDNQDFTTNFTAVLTTLNNVGPGLAKVGPIENFFHFSYFSKLVLSMDMLVGRLEILPMLMLFAPQVWRKKF